MNAEQRAREIIDRYSDELDSAQRRIIREKITEALTQCRQETIEEAAKVAESYFDWKDCFNEASTHDEIAEAIRKLKGDGA